ncbi:hypothetical protein AB205_0077200, partial [Aquarana catesbeiana]
MDDVQLLSGERWKMYDKSGVHYLEIRDVCREDAGNYSVTVTNSCGRSSVCAELVVQGGDKTDGTSAPLGGSVTRTAKPPITSNGILKTHRDAIPEKSRSMESAARKQEPNVEPMKAKSSYVSKGVSSVPSTAQHPSLKSESSTAFMRGTPSPLTDSAGSQHKQSEESSPTTQAKTQTTRTAKETPSIVSRYTSVLDPKDRSPVPSRETETKPPGEPCSQNLRSLDIKTKSLVETKFGSPKVTSTVVSSYSSSIESKVRPSQTTPEAQSPSSMETTSLSSRYISSGHNIGSYYTPNLPATTKETVGCKSAAKTENVFPQKLASSRLADISSTDGIMLADKPSKETSVPLRTLTSKGESTFISIHDKKSDKTLVEPPLKTSCVSTKETLRTTQYITPKLEPTKETGSICQSTANILLKKSSVSSPNLKSDLPFDKTHNVISGVHHRGRASEVTSSGSVGDGKFQQKSSSTITLKSVKILPSPETGRNVTGQKENVEVSKIQEVSFGSGDDQKGAAETDSSEYGTAPKFDLTPSSQEVLEGSSVTFRCK